jgi:hypothetical protein
MRWHILCAMWWQRSTLLRRILFGTQGTGYRFSPAAGRPIHRGGPTWSANGVTPRPRMTPLTIADTAGMPRCGGAGFADRKASGYGRSANGDRQAARKEEPPRSVSTRPASCYRVGSKSGSVFAERSHEDAGGHEQGHMPLRRRLRANRDRVYGPGQRPRQVPSMRRGTMYSEERK